MSEIAEACDVSTSLIYYHFDDKESVLAALSERIQAELVAPAFGQLALNCPPEIAEGADGAGEIGAMNGLGNPARIANMRDALDEYLPFGLEAGLIFVT